MKKAGVIFLIAAVLLLGIYTAVTVATSSEADVELYNGAAKPTARNVEIIYNSLMFDSGSYRVSVQISANESKLNLGKSSSEAEAFAYELKVRLGKIKTMFADAGIDVTYDESKGFINAVMAEYKNADEMAIANGETGYDKPVSLGTSYKGYFYSDYVIKRQTAFIPQEEPTYIDKIYEILVGDDFISEDEVDFVFNYGTAYSSRLISSDADYIYKYREKESGLSSYVHEFRMTNATRSREITLLQHAPNTTSWYIIIITAVLIAVGIVLLVAGAKKARQ